MSRIRLTAFTTVVALGLAMPAMAAEVKVTEKSNKFSPKNLTIAVGDTVTWVNQDGYTHNVHSKTKGHIFNIGLQEAGGSDSLKFDKAGTVKIRCSIHPKMRMTIKVQ
ncbi:MAG: methylamine utilization protein [Rhodospirillales bacterium]|nr:methylamine utilization protein [Rhodospirillales bacterium]